MSVDYEGKQKLLRDPVMTEGCLGPRDANIYLDRGKWSAVFVEGVTTQTVDMKPSLGET